MKRLLLLAVSLATAATAFTGCEKPEDDIGAGKPAAVENLTATPGNAQVVLDWETPADDGGSPITGYELTHDNWANKVTKMADELTHTYTGLTNSTEYTFRVRAVNADGSGAESTATATPTAPTGPTGYLTDWTLPANLKIVFTDDGITYTTVKIGNRYWSSFSDGPYAEWYVAFDPATGRAVSYGKATGKNWSKMSDATTTENSFRANELYQVYGTVVSDIGKASARPPAGNDIVAGRPVQIRINALNDTYYYIDNEYYLVLKRRLTKTSAGMEVTLWDETVTDFGGINLPE